MLALKLLMAALFAAWMFGVSIGARWLVDGHGALAGLALTIAFVGVAGLVELSRGGTPFSRAPASETPRTGFGPWEGWKLIFIAPIVAPYAAFCRSRSIRGSSFAGSLYKAATAFVVSMLIWFMAVALPALLLGVLILEAVN